MFRRALGPGAAILLAGCGGGATGGTYCLTVTPATHNFECAGGTLSVEVLNACGAAVTLEAPFIEEHCADRISVAPGEAGTTVEDGASAAFEITYAPVGTDVWDCQVQFLHDLTTEPAPAVSLAGGGTACEGS